MSGLRVLRIGNVYPAYWQQLYARRPELQRRNHREQLEAIFYDLFSQSDSYSHYLRKIGYECLDVIGNVTPLQKRWAEENGVRWQPGSFVREYPLIVARQFKPDVVFLNDFTVFGTDFCHQLRRVCPSVRLVVGWCATYVASSDPLRGYDLVLTSIPPLADRFEREGLRAKVLRHAFDPRVLSRIDCSAPRTTPLSFVGSVLRGPGMHDFRGEVLKALIENFDVRLYCPGFERSPLETAVRRTLYHTVRLLRGIGIPEPLIRPIPGLNKALRWNEKPLFKWEDPIGSRSQGGRYGLDMYQTLAQSMVTLNVHGSVGGDYSGNIRLFEATGVGTPLLTDWKKDLSEQFDLDNEVVTFTSLEECVEKARWLLDNPKKCREIGERGQIRTLAEHSYANRVAELDDVFRKAVR